PATAAIRTAYRLQQRLDEHNEERRQKGLKTHLTMGVGVHFGDALAGTIGSTDRMQYTVVGDVVNTASRLESATKAQGQAVLISGACVDAARARRDAETSDLPELFEKGSIEVRGREERMRIYAFAEDCSEAWQAYLEASATS
ncbi:MAG: adenylate/guanylate cyclase domain-containing protein, partial [Proteobacteria bacterium]|nr:adenylate/guanylate cyclase domain-containing protein [Pseudomonadota bacterium]